MKVNLGFVFAQIIKVNLFLHKNIIIIINKMDKIVIIVNNFKYKIKYNKKTKKELEEYAKWLSNLSSIKKK